MSSDIRVHRSERYQPVSITSWQKILVGIRSATHYIFFFHFQGCIQYILEWSMLEFVIIIAISCGSAIIEIMSIVMSLYLIKNIRIRNKDVQSWQWQMTANSDSGYHPNWNNSHLQYWSHGHDAFIRISTGKIYDALISLWLHFVDICFTKTFRLSDLFECIKDLLLSVEFLLL